jgi:hypothetical protein
MKVRDFISVCDGYTEIYFIDHAIDDIVVGYKDKYSVNERWMDYDVIHIDSKSRVVMGKDCNCINVTIDVFNVMYDELNAEAKLNCINDYVYKIYAYEHFDDLNTMQELEECVREFFINSEYHLDKFGNWYDENNRKI